MARIDPSANWRGFFRVGSESVVDYFQARPGGLCLIDGQMMEWLASADSFSTVEVDGPWILLATDKLDPAHWLDLGTWLDQFHALRSSRAHSP